MDSGLRGDNIENGLDKNIYGLKYAGLSRFGKSKGDLNPEGLLSHKWIPVYGTDRISSYYCMWMIFRC